MPRRPAHQVRQALQVLTGGVKAPPRPTGLLRQTRLEWEAFWESDAARTVKPMHVPALLALFRLRDRRERFRRLGMKAPLVRGSMGQVTTNPLLRAAEALEGPILTLEREFGLTPRSWINMGGALGDAGRSLADLNRELAAGDEEEGVDPRLAALERQPD